MQTNNFYEEKIFSKCIFLIMTSVNTIFFFVLIYQIIISPAGTQSAPNWIILLMFLINALVIINFSRLSINMNSHFIIVSYGIFKRKIKWNNIDYCYLDDTSIFRYGGWGIRFGKVKGKWRLVYNIIGAKTVVLS